jgi:hypothetical protein
MRKKNYIKVVGVAISEETYEQIREITNLKEISTAEFLRNLIYRELESQTGKSKGGNKQ